MVFQRLSLVLIILSGALAPCAQAENAALRKQFFQEKVEPILIGHCLECHGSERKGELDLRSRETVLAGGESGVCIEPGKPEESLLYEYVSTEQMPPENPLSADQVAALKQWIAEGAYFPDEPLDLFSVTTDRRAGYDWWSLQPLTDVSPPTSPALPQEWANNPVDRFIFAKLAEQKLLPSEPADARTLIRRATYDLLGMPPTRDEVEAFRKQCELETGSSNRVGEKAYQALIDRLLASPHYGEHWGRHWLDVVRFGESRGFERNEIINNAWPFRDYVIRSLNEDKPFDQLMTEHLAGDVLDPGNLDVEAGAIFLVSGPYDDVGNQDAVQAAQIRANTIDEIIRATSESFLGLTVGCARCHDHKFDPIAQRDYYRLYATFAGVHHGSRVAATDEQRQEVEKQKQPLNDELEKLTEKKSQLENAILARAEKSATTLEVNWTRPAVNRQLTEEKFAPREARYVRLVGEATDTNPASESGYHIDEFEVWTAGQSPRNVALASNGATAEGDSRIANDFAAAYSAQLTNDGKFGARWLAAAPILTLTLPQLEVIDRITFSSDRSGAAGQNPVAAFLCEYRIEISLDGQEWTTMATSHDRQPVSDAHRHKRLIDLETTSEERQRFAELASQIAEVQAKLAAIPQLPSWWIGNAQQPDGSFHIFLGGNPQRKGEAVVPASLTTLADVAGQYRLSNEAPESERRLEMAKWIVAAENPLPPRVLANRLWHYHFGTGIVDTPNDFGFMGARPSHPELLDWLATKIREEGWKIKPMHKLIMLSQTYRQSSKFREEAARVDAQARWLWRFPPRRLSAEEIRDTMLQVSGKLNTEMGGRGFRLYDYWQDNVATYVPLEKFGPETYRRSVYHQNARAARIDLMTEFDSPDCAFSAPRRASTTTPLQALTLMNHSFTIDMAEALAERIAAEDDQTSIRQAFQLLFSRPCSAEEMTAAEHFVKEHGLSAFCRAMFNANEFIYVN